MIIEHGEMKEIVHTWGGNQDQHAQKKMIVEKELHIQLKDLKTLLNRKVNDVDSSLSIHFISI